MPFAPTHSQHTPDILDCLAQLSNDEVPTPPKLARAMLDLMPKKVWTNPHYKWLDPGCKSGVFLREVATRLLQGLIDWEPDFRKRREHVFRKMLYGASVTEMTGYIARRSVYCSRDATGPHSIVRFSDQAGNIPFISAEHRFEKGRCVVCGASEALERGESRENYAYAFIHDAYPTSEMVDMKFDVIVGNPPYQIGMKDASGKKVTNILPLYHHFVTKAIELDPRYVVMITPSRWFTGGKGLDEFRERMISDRRLRILVDNPKVFDCFPGVEIMGGVSYFLWDRNYNGDCQVSTRLNGEIISTETRDLREGEGVLIRDNRAADIIRKVRDGTNSGSLAEMVCARDPFGQKITTNYKYAKSRPFRGSVPLIFGSKVEYVKREQLERHREWVDQWKVLIPKAYNGGQQVDDEGIVRQTVLGEPIALSPGSACTQTYLVAGIFDTRREAENYAYYLATKFVRFLVLQRKSTQDVTPERFRFVPRLDMKRRWTDQDLYDKYHLTDDECAYIEKSIKPRSVNLSLKSPVPTSHLPGGCKYRSAS